MVTHHPQLKYGVNPLTSPRLHKNMLMDVSLLRLKRGERHEFNQTDKEAAFLLLTGKVEMRWGDVVIASPKGALQSRGVQETISRNSVFEENPWCLHVPAKTKVEIIAKKESEILVQMTKNKNKFEPYLYKPEECISEIFGDNVWENTARRKVRTVFDYSNAPYSNMVMGELINYPGRWSSYIPHHHPQPEVYFFKFDKPQGFGVSIIGDDAYIVKNNSLAAIQGGLTHPQCSAPGYSMYYCWMIRHFDNAPWKDRIFDKNHTWLLEEK